MEKLQRFMKYISGYFNNEKQLKDEEEATGEVNTPVAKHIVGICNDKIKNLPKDFNGAATKSLWVMRAVR